MDWRTPTLAVATMALLVTAPARATTTYDALADFSTTSSTGIWSYGTGVTGSSFTPYPVFIPATPDFPVASWKVRDPVLGVPNVSIDTAGAFFHSGTVLFDPNVVYMHPGPDTDSIVRFTAPAAGTYEVSGYFELLDISPTGVEAIYGGGSDPLQSFVLTGPGAQFPDTPGGRVHFSESVDLAAGQDFFFGVNNDGDFLFDSTGLSATITTSGGGNSGIPEPSSWAFMLGGFGLMGLALRLRRRATCGWTRDLVASLI